MATVTEVDLQLNNWRLGQRRAPGPSTCCTMLVRTSNSVLIGHLATTRVAAGSGKIPVYAEPAPALGRNERLEINPAHGCPGPPMQGRRRLRYLRQPGLHNARPPRLGSRGHGRHVNRMAETVGREACRSSGSAPGLVSGRSCQLEGSRTKCRISDHLSGKSRCCKRSGSGSMVEIACQILRHANTIRQL